MYKYPASNFSADLQGVDSSLTEGEGDQEYSLLDLARKMQLMRARMAKLFPRNVFRDSAWDMVLELFVAGRENRAVCVKELVLTSGETSTSALRRIDRLEAAELLRRSHDSADHRRVVVTLTLKGEEAMVMTLRNLFLTVASLQPRGSRPDQPPLGGSDRQYEAGRK
ncbi:MarR family transcriptional regulator [Sphingomonas sp. DT-207]|uniref:MarR family transcriptional regulator n=1 Tax=Sphingomonas sp. DT-207 TaxID=3396167 RepID=UPI003F1C683A